MIFVDGGNDRVVIGGSNVTAGSTFAVTYPQAKTDTSTRYVHAWQSNDNFSSISVKDSSHWSC